MATKINPIICIDVETGGKSPIKNPITQIAYEAFQLDDYESLGEYSTYIKPYNDLVLDKEATDVTGITLEKLLKEGIDIKVAMKKICEDFQSFNVAGGRFKKPILMGHNVGFDIGFITFAFNFCKLDIGKYLDCNEDMYGNPVPKYIDTLGLCKLAWGASKDDLKYKLGLCVTRAGLPQFDAHSAMNDVRATTGLGLFLTEKLRGESSGEKQTVIRENTVRKHFQF